MMLCMVAGIVHEGAIYFVNYKVVLVILIFGVVALELNSD